MTQPRAGSLRCRLDGRAGFTLIEMLIVVAILALLAALIAPRVLDALGESQTQTTRVQIQQLEQALASFRLDNGRFPTAGEGLDALGARPDGLATWSGPYLSRRELPTDGWGNPFNYDRPASRGGIDYDLWSWGADGEPGGEGENADIGNW